MFLAVLFALNVAAQEDPTLPEEQDPTLPNKAEIVCGATASFSSAKYGATRDSSTGNVFKLKPVAGSADKRANTEGVISLERGHEFSFNLTWIPRASNLVRGEDLMTATVRYQRRDSNKVKVLAESVLTSDQITNFGQLQGRRVDLTLGARMNNPEVATIKVNRLGQVPDGLTTVGTFECSMRVGVSNETL